MIKTLIFDFGDVFINLNKEATNIELQKLGIQSFNYEMLQHNIDYEIGKIDTKSFIEYYKTLFPKLNDKQVSQAWNAIILDFPEYRLNFIEALSAIKKYRLILLSNTNELHIEKVIEIITLKQFHRFKNCFDAFYLSHEVHLRKPDSAIFDFVLNKHKLIPKECLFIDDTKKNTVTAKELGIPSWNINPETEDIIDIFTLKKELF